MRLGSSGKARLVRVLGWWGLGNVMMKDLAPCFGPHASNRERDWVDIEGVLRRQNNRLNWAQISEELAPLADVKSEPAIVARLHALRDANNE